MKRTFTFLLCGLMGIAVMAQNPTGVFKKASVAPVIDGILDDVWAESNVYNIDKPFQAEVPTLGASGETTWKALWTADGVYVFLKVTDDANFPNYAVTPAGNNWEYDKPEIYFDVNYELMDGVGAGGNAGHIQVAPGFTNGKNDGTAITDNQVVYAFLVDGSNYTAEYFIPFARLIDKLGVEVDKTGTIGFDVTIIDRDPGDAARKRAVWANVGALNESYSNMNDAGHVTFDGADAAVYVDVITLTGGTITADNGTLQIGATIEPADATNQKLRWTVENGTGIAKISSTGLLTAIGNGTVTVKAAAVDGGWTEATPLEITISGQVIDNSDVWNSLNLISNWNFDTDVSGWGGWQDGAVADQVAPVVEDGVCVMKVGLAAENWHYQHNQSPLNGVANVPYTLKFKSWASADATPCAVDFESTGGSDLYARYGHSSDPEAVNGTSEWSYTVSTTPTWFTFHVVFDNMIATTGQKIQWMNSLSNETIYLDSVLLIQDAQLALVSTGIKQLSVNAMKVYPNPVGAGNELMVSLATPNARVSIYNAIGQKLMEKVASGTIAKFNVSSLKKGMYFVRLDDGTSQKFIR